MSKDVFPIRSSGTELLGAVLLISLFGVTRLVLVLQGVRPDITQLYNHWQHLVPHLLKSDPFQSIALLHSQPPLWNALLGFLFYVSGGSDHRFLIAYTTFSFLISLGTALLMYFSLLRLKVSRTVAIISSSVYIVASSAYFYEVHISYALLSAFLVMVFFSTLAYGFSSIRQQFRFFFSILSCLCLVSLSMIWTLFHPALVVITFCGILWFVAARETGTVNTCIYKNTYLIVVGILLVLLTLIVPIKNLILFDYFGSGTWLGMNLSQVDPRAQKNCTFEMPLNDHEINSAKNLTLFTKSISHPSISSIDKREGFRNYNHIGYIVRSESCKSQALKSIAENPTLFAKARIRQFLISHIMLSDSYFIFPKGLENGSVARRWADVRNIIYAPIPWKSNRRIHFGPIFIPIGILAGAYLLAFSSDVRVALPAGSFASLTAGLWLMIWLYTIGYFFNGVEHERMRFTIEPLLITWFSLIGYHVWPLLAGHSRSLLNGRARSIDH